MRKVRGPRRHRGKEKVIGRHQGPEGFASKYEQKVYHDAKKRNVPVRYEPAAFFYERRGRGAYCRSCGSREVVKRAKYTPDFGIGGAVFIETKGKFDASTRSKHEDFKASRPDVDLRFIFAADNWVTKKHARRYSDWCRERGIKYAVGQEIPEEWVEEASKSIASDPPTTLHPEPKRGGMPRCDGAYDVQPRKRGKVPVAGGDQGPGEI
jgi:hypothetical protein